MSRQGQLAGQYPADDLNQVNDNLLKLVGDKILIKAKYKASKEVQIQLTKAVALEFKRSTINAAQKASRQLTKTTAMLESSNDNDSSNSKSNSKDSIQRRQSQQGLRQQGHSDSFLKNPSQHQLENTKAKYHGFYERARVKQYKSRENVEKFIEPRKLRSIKQVSLYLVQKVLALSIVSLN